MGEEEEAYVLALGDGGKVDLDLGHGEDVGGGGHVDKEVCAVDVSAPLLYMQ